MSDLFTPMREFNPPSAPLDPAEVRRLGDRRRRRRSAYGVGAAALVLGVVGGAVALGGTTPGSSPALPADQPDDAASSSAPTSAGAIPDNFPLGVGLPPASMQFDMRGADNPPTGESTGPVCGTLYELPGRPLDRAAIEGTNAQYAGLRDVAVYGSAAEAQTAVRSQVERLSSCPREGSAASGTTTTTVQPIPGLGDRAWLGLRVYDYEGTPMGVEVYYLVQRGAAAVVLHEQTSDDAAVEPASRDAYLRGYLDDTVEPVIEALCSVDGVDC